MVSFQSLVFTLLLVTGWAAALPTRPVRMPPYNWLSALCKLSPRVQKALCPRQDPAGTVTVNTPLGVARGTGGNGARFAVRYATVERWQPSKIATAWQLPDGATDVTTLPVPCAQLAPDGDSFTGSEDCLSMLLYVPSTVKSGSDAPTFLWIHGGSFVQGSATAAGLDGSKLAAATNSIVAVVQYRLGAFGFLAPNGDLNLAVRDVMNSLQFLQKVLPSFGGAPSKITLAGQSAGANMIRALLATPSASPLFQSAILQSDVTDYGFLSTALQNTLQGMFNNNVSCAASDAACFDKLSMDDILNAQTSITRAAAGAQLDPAFTQAQPIRPVLDGALLTSTLNSQSPFPRVSKPLLISSVKDEAGATIFGGFPGGVTNALYQALVSFTFGATRSGRILGTELYASAPPVNGVDVDQRATLETLGTDQVWRCPAWTLARDYTRAGGRAYVGEYVVGATYPGNEGVPFCMGEGVVCHQDDIQIVFGTAQNPNPKQAALIKEMQARYAAFLHTGVPNAPGLATWDAAETEDVHAINLGAPGLAPVQACNTSYWGSFVQYDYQVYNL